MIFQPVVSGGGASGGSDWKEVDRSYVAEHVNDQGANFLVAVFTTDFPDQPMIIPISEVFLIGDVNVGTASKCWFGAGSENPRPVYLLSTYEFIIMTNDPDMMEGIMYLQIDSASVADDTVPEGWKVKYYAYTPS